MDGWTNVYVHRDARRRTFYYHSYIKATDRDDRHAARYKVLHRISVMFVCSVSALSGITTLRAIHIKNHNNNKRSNIIKNCANTYTFIMRQAAYTDIFILNFLSLSIFTHSVNYSIYQLFLIAREKK